jgi:hypothetical protein
MGMSEVGIRGNHNPITVGKGPAGSGGGITGWQDGSGIGSGLARPDMDGSVLRRRSWSALALPESDNRTTGTGAGNTKLSELIPRFLRLSALVAIELGSEVRDEEVGEKVGGGLPDVVSSVVDITCLGMMLIIALSLSIHHLHLCLRPAQYPLPALPSIMPHERSRGCTQTHCDPHRNGTCY